MSIETRNLLLKTFSQAVGQLEAALKQPKDEFIRDSAIQRFEFTFELSWKLLKVFLETEGMQARSPREAIQGSFQVGFIPDDPGWLGLIELRNLTSHTYDRKIAERVYRQLPGALKRFRALSKKLQIKPRKNRKG